MDKEKRSKESLFTLYNYIMQRLPQFPFILFYGSLLGYIREGGFIEGDDDIDVLLPVRERNRLLYAIQRLSLSVTVNERGIIQTYVPNMGCVDIYFYEDRNLDILIPWDGNLLFSKQDIWPLKRVTFHGHKINIPYNSEKILQETYRTNWRVPIKKDEYTWESIHSVRKL